MFFQGKRVSGDWFYVLTEVARRVPVPLNDGQRTMADQWARVRKHGVYNSRTNPHGAAIPSPNAPHIKIGRQDHALDLNMPQGQATLREIERLGVPMKNTVFTEPWHWETTDRAALHRAAVKYGQRQRLLAKLRDRYARVKAAIDKRQKQGKASPGQRELLKKLRGMIARRR